LHAAWNKRVVAGGILTRNAAGQAVRLDLEELILLPDETEQISAWNLLGIDPDYTGALSTDEYLDRTRRG
jgi:hypothetical protein